MAAHFDIFSIGFLVLFVGLTWIGPRYFGLFGMVGVHLFVLMGYLALALFAMEAGRYEYDGELSMLGLFIQAFLLNCLLLPISLVALWRYRRSSRE